MDTLIPWRELMTYIGLAFSAQMLGGLSEADIHYKKVDADYVKSVMTGTYTSCCNPFHKASLSALKKRHGIDVPVDEKPPKVSLQKGDTLIVMQITGLPRETREFTDEEVAQATFGFCEFKIQ